MKKVLDSPGMYSTLAPAVLFLSMALAAQNVNASESGGGSSQIGAGASEAPEAHRKKELALEAMSANILDTGSEIAYQQGVSDLLGVPVGAKARRKTAARKESVDGLLRAFDVLVDPSTTTPRALGLVLRKGWKDIALGETKTLILHLDRHGVLERAFEINGKLDQQGRAIESSGVGKTETLDIQAPGIRLLLKRELDFWLKGTGRKSNIAGNQAKESAVAPAGPNR